MLLDPPPEGLEDLGRRFDGVLGPRSEWVDYHGRPEVRPLWDLGLASECKATVGVAAVTKKDGEQLRKILQSVPFNTMLHSPSQLLGEELDYGLEGGTALAQMEYDDSGARANALDLSNAFTYIETPPSYWRYMGGPAVRAEELPADWVAGRWRPGEWLRPYYRRLGMGMTHEVVILQKIVVTVVWRTLLASAPFSEAVLLNDKVHREQRVDMRGPLGARRVACYVHLDDIGFFSALRERVDAARQAVAAGLKELGFDVKEEEPEETGRYPTVGTS